MHPCSTSQALPVAQVERGPTASGRAQRPGSVSATPPGSGRARPHSSRLLFGGPERLRVRPEDLRREFEEPLRGAPQCSSNSLRHSATGWSDRRKTRTQSPDDTSRWLFVYAEVPWSDARPTRDGNRSDTGRTMWMQARNSPALYRPTEVGPRKGALWTR
jgi:hypothetical protein